MEIPCIQCAADGTSCCVNKQICLTRGDIDRLAAAAPGVDAATWEEPDASFLDFHDDPEWQHLTLYASGLRQVLRRKENRDCIMLTPTGCSIALEERPLICRIHPYDYRREGVLKIDSGCPIHKLSNGIEVLEFMNMDVNTANAWIRQIYQELDVDKANDMATPLPPIEAMPMAI